MPMDPPSGNHESPKSKIQKRKKARSNTPLSCKIEYYIKANSAYFSGQSAFFTNDYCATIRNGKSHPYAKQNYLYLSALLLRQALAH